MSNIHGIWNNAYVQEIGIVSHCNEVTLLKDEINRIKAFPKSDDNLIKLNAVSDTFEREMMDLYIILEKWAESKDALKDERIARFKEKATKPSTLSQEDRLSSRAFAAALKETGAISRLCSMTQFMDFKEKLNKKK